MNDEEAIEAITEAFIKAMIHNKMYHRESYVKVLKRVTDLLAMEWAWRYSKEEEKTLMDTWGSELN